jgi:hypothetical protein
MIIDKKITIKIEPREDGGLRIWSDDLPGLILSHSNQQSVLLDLGPAIIGMCTGVWPLLYERKTK